MKIQSEEDQSGREWVRINLCRFKVTAWVAENGSALKIVVFEIKNQRSTTLIVGDDKDYSEEEDEGDPPVSTPYAPKPGSEEWPRQKPAKRNKHKQLIGEDE